MDGFSSSRVELNWCSVSVSEHKIERICRIRNKENSSCWFEESTVA